MKSRIVLGLVLAATFSSLEAQASRARDLILGTGDAGAALNGGSFLYDGGYNIFYNPAYINDFTRWAIIEKSNFPGATAQGGIVDNIFLFNYGVFLNRANSIVTHPQLAGGAALPYELVPTRPIELFVGADWGFKWGVALSYATNKTTAGRARDLSVHLGAIAGSFEPFLTLKPSGSEPGRKHYFYRTGLRYRWGEWTPYLVALTAGDRETDVPAPVRVKEITYGLGLARSTRIAEGIKMNYGAGYYKIADSGGSPSGDRKVLPLDISFEGSMNSWFTLLGGVSYHLLDQLNGNTLLDLTTGRIGARVANEKVALEWALGNNRPDLAAEQGAATESQVVDFAHGFFTALNVSFRW